MLLSEESVDFLDWLSWRNLATRSLNWPRNETFRDVWYDEGRNVNAIEEGTTRAVVFRDDWRFEKSNLTLNFAVEATEGFRPLSTKFGSGMSWLNEDWAKSGKGLWLKEMTGLTSCLVGLKDDATNAVSRWQADRRRRWPTFVLEHGSLRTPFQASVAVWIRWRCGSHRCLSAKRIKEM